MFSLDSEHYFTHFLKSYFTQLNRILFLKSSHLLLLPISTNQCQRTLNWKTNSVYALRQNCWKACLTHIVISESVCRSIHRVKLQYFNINQGKKKIMRVCHLLIQFASLPFKRLPFEFNWYKSAGYFLLFRTMNRIKHVSFFGNPPEIDVIFPHKNMILGSFFIINIWGKSHLSS